MSPLPPDNTPRLLVDYNDAIHDHTFTWRFSASLSSISAAMSAAAAFLSALEPSWYAITILGARFIDEGSSVSVPVGWTGADAYGSGSMPAVNAPRETRFEMKSSDGRRCSLGLYGGNYATPATYRLPATSFTFVANGVEQLVLATDTLALISISGLSMFVKAYANVNFNSYWEGQARN